MTAEPDLLSASKIQPDHLRRKGVVYVRQSTLAQVRNNLESQRRQYALKGRLEALGWSPASIEVIDEDQGRSGAASENRSGFQRLVSEVALGRVGIVFCLETSRLTRSNEDWQRLLTICEVRDTLLADAEGVYSLRIYNDRMLLGLKGTVSEIELHTILARMSAGAKNKAERGEFLTSVPVGYVLSEIREIEKSADEEVRSAIARVFDKFREVGSVYGTTLALEEEDWRLPRRTDYFGRRPVRWEAASNQAVSMMLRTPFYAGAYAWGRARVQTTVSDAGKIEKHRHRRGDPSVWPILLRDHHPGYITWAEFEENRRRLLANRRGFGHPGPVGRGSSILAGLVRCSSCDAAMVLSYGGRHHEYSHFQCPRRSPTFERNPCQTFAGRTLENRIEELLLSVLEPQSFDAVLMAEADVEGERTRQMRQWDMELERARQAENLAHRRYEAVDPGNRLVARTLEERWENALRALEATKKSREQRLAHMPPPLNEKERRELRRVVGRFDLLWRSDSTTPQQRKELTRLLVHHVTARINRESSRLHANVHWVTGHVSHETISMPRQRGPYARIQDDDRTIIRRMAADYTDAEIAAVLGRAARRTPDDTIWTARRVMRVRKAEGWEKIRGSARAYVSMNTAIQMLRTDRNTLEKRIRRGEVGGTQLYPGAHWRISRADVEHLKKRLELDPHKHHRIVRKGGLDFGP
jgi:DNA invertase Pin-like site-specific DNA recombinase